MVAKQSQSLRVTALHDRHVSLGARMVAFAGWEMPIQYAGILNEHQAVRSAAGLFDLGHMGQVDVAGKDAQAFLQYTTTNDIGQLQPGQAIYSLIPNTTGGVIDDIIVYRRPGDDNGYMVVVNAANTGRDIEWLTGVRAEHEDWAVELRDISQEISMIAIQGPEAIAVSQSVSQLPLQEIAAFSWRPGRVAGVQAMIARTGYTGEDGFEFYVGNQDAGRLWDALLAAGDGAGIQPVGLGARDTLRLEARMPLYGQELGEDISPFEAGLGWAVALDKGAFIGRDALAQVKAEGAPRRTVGFRQTERGGTARTSFEVQVEGAAVGKVTSGAYSPTLGGNVGLALIEREYAGVGKPLSVIVRDKPVAAVQVKTPFYRRARTD